MWFKKRKQDQEQKQDKEREEKEKTETKSSATKIGSDLFLEKNLELLPIISEKTKALVNKENTYTFKIRPVSVNKTEIKKAIEKIFKVKVLGVRTVNYKKRIRGRTRIPNVRYRFKKAYVKIADGQKINIFE